MEKKDIIILVACLALLGFSLYRKYMKKSVGKDKTGSNSQKGSQFSSNSDDDYEPYSGK
jgi:uncharacterized membrane protein YebE (DUF533 family)